MSDRKNTAGSAHQMRYVSAQQDNVAMLLRQLGADVKEIHGLVCFVRFSVSGEELLYVYNLNADNQYYLQRAKPYPMSAGVFPTADAIFGYIERDLSAFQNAMKSGHYAAFVDINRRIVALSQGLEETFLKYSISGDCFTEAQKGLEQLEKVLGDIRHSAAPRPSFLAEERQAK